MDSDNDHDYDDDLVDNPRPMKRFKHQSYTETLKQVHLVPSYEEPQTFLIEDDNATENASSLSAASGSTFHASLTHWRQLNLSPVFIRFADKVDPLSASMPLLLLNWERIVGIWVEAMDGMGGEGEEGEGGRVLLDLMQKMVYDLRGTMDAAYETLLMRVLGLLPSTKAKSKSRVKTKSASASKSPKSSHSHISAATLTTLLSTLSALFKFLLVPSLSTTTQATQTHPRLRQTWHHIHIALSQTGFPEVQRALAEVWGAALRRMKGGERRAGVESILGCFEDDDESVGMSRSRGVEDACAWVVIFACKSVSQTLHTCTPSIFQSILDVYLSPSNSAQLTQTLIRRALTALIHHCRNATAFAPLGDVLVARFVAVMRGFVEVVEAGAEANDNNEALRKIIDILSIPCSVRQGSRLTQSHLTQILSSLPPIAYLPLSNHAVNKGLVKLVGGVLSAGEAGMPVWGVVTKKGGVVEGGWEVGSASGLSAPSGVDDDAEGETTGEKKAKAALTFVLNLSATLASLSPSTTTSSGGSTGTGTGPFKGFKPLLLPLLLKYTARPEVRQRDPRGVARVLAGVVRHGWVVAPGKGTGKGKGTDKDKCTGMTKGGEVDAGWRARMEEWCVERVRGLVAELELVEQGHGWVDLGTATHITDILKLTSLFSSSSPDICGVLVDGIKRLFTVSFSPSSSSSKLKSKSKITRRIQKLNEKQSLPLCWALAQLMHALAARDPAEWSALVVEDVGVWVGVCLGSGDGSASGDGMGTGMGTGMEDVLGGLVEIVKRINMAAATSSTTPIDTHVSIPPPPPSSYAQHHTSILSLLLSPTQSTRLTALRLLDSPSPSPHSLINTHPAVRTAAQACLRAEQVPIDVCGVRERVLRIGRVGGCLFQTQRQSQEQCRGEGNEGEKEAAELLVVWLVAQLKVSLRPLWAPACAALGTLAAEGWGDVVWEVVWREMRGVEAQRGFGGGEDDDNEGDDEQGEEDEEEDEEDDDPWEEERSWRDPAAHKLRSTVSRWVNGDAAAYQELLKAQTPTGRFDIHSYETQLISALTVFPSLAEKHNRDLIPWFLSLSPFSSPTQSTQSPTALILPKPRLTPYLTLFSKFTNPKALVHTSALRETYTALLAHPDRALQALALDCILTYRPAGVLACEETLRAVLDEGRFRDAVTGLQLGEEGNSNANADSNRKEIVDITIRVLYGVMLDRGSKGRVGGGVGGASDRRAAVLGALSGCSESELALLVDLMLKPLGLTHESHSGEEQVMLDPLPAYVSDRQRTGFLTLLGDVLRYLGPKIVRYWPALVGATVRIVGDAQRRVDRVAAVGVMHEHEEQEHEQEERDEAEEEGEKEGGEEPKEGAGAGAGSGAGSPKSIRAIRQLGVKRITDFFTSPASHQSPSGSPFDFTPYLAPSFPFFISPRLATLPAENAHTQSPSALLELFAAWTTHSRYVRYLVAYDKDVLPGVYGCLVHPSVKEKVVGRVFDVVERVLSAAADSDADEEGTWIRDHVVKPYMSLLLTNLASLFQRSTTSTSSTSSTSTGIPISSPLFQRQIHILSEIAHYATDSAQAETLLRLIAPLLKRPGRIVQEGVKVDLLRTCIGLMGAGGIRDEGVYGMMYDVLSTLFQSLRSRQARLALVSAFQELARLSPSSSTTSLGDVAVLLTSLNAYSTKRLSEPDFDARLAAFQALNEGMYKTLGWRDWVPVIYQMLHAIQDGEELAVRGSAAFGLRRFVERVVETNDDEYQVAFGKIFYPGLKNGLRSKNEMVRAEVLGVIAYSVEKSEDLSLPSTSTAPRTPAASACASAFASLKEMRILLENNDPEANFFNNVLHVQVHRRARALRRLAEHCDEGHLRSATLAEVFVPLVGNYVSAGVDHHLVTEAILTTGKMARHLAWGAYYALVQRYLRVTRRGKEGKEGKDGEERICVRTLVALLDNFHFPMEEVVPQGEGEGEGEEEEEEADVEEPAIKPPRQQHQQPTAKIADAVNLRLLPTLLNHLEKRDPETDDNTRIPIAIGIVTVAKHLPPSTREPQITRLLTILSQILRSRSQETRDLTKESLNRIVVALGVTYVPLLLKELRAALLRGPQLHVLAYVVHSLLVHVTTGEHKAAFELLDDCVNDVAYVSAEVVFGESGKDVQSEDFKTKMREVRSSTAKGLDAFGIMAKFISPEKISSLLAPLKAIMQETASLKVMNLVEEVLKRVAGGLNSNMHLVPKELLVLCNTLVSRNSRFLQQSAPSTSRGRKQKGAKGGDAIVQVKRQDAVKVDHYANNSFRFVTFGLDLLNTAMRRNRFDFHDAEVMSRLNSMVVVVGNTLYSTSAPVLLLGLRSAAGLVKCPLKSLDKSLPVFVRQILDIIQQTGSTESEVVQVAFKSLATILRDGPPVQVKEKDLVYLLELLAPDLEDPERQASVFTMLRAIVARKFVVPEIYDLMDKVSEVMVTSQSAQVQELCRGVLLQFLLDYPQGKGRLRKQMMFFAKNLSYVYESGRKSVMELLGAIITKFQETLIREYADLLFVALVMVIANDDSTKCREMAAVLIKSLFGRLDDERRKLIFSHLHSWASQQAQPQLARVSSQVYGFVIDVLEANSKPYIITILEDLNAALDRSAEGLAVAETQDTAEPAVELDWQAPYYALTVLAKVLRVFPDFATRVDRVRWDRVVPHLLFPHAWVRTASCRLLGVLFTAVAPAPPNAQHADSYPLSNPGMQEVAKKLCLQLKSEYLDEALALQIVKNLFYIGKCFYVMAPSEAQDDDASDEEDDEDEEKEAQDTELLKQQNPLPWLFSKLSYQVKSAHIARRNRTSNNTNWSQQPLAVLRWFAAMTSHMEAIHLERFLVHVLTPLYRLLEEDTIRDSQMDELKTLATELQDLVQAKVGTTKFSTTYNQIRQSVLEVRRDRKTARATQAVANPEAAAKRKMQRNVIKKESRKRKDRGFAEKHGRTKRRRGEEAM